MSWSDTNIITSSKVKEVCGLDKNVEDRKIDPCIHFAQRDLRQILGRTLYDLVEDADPVGDDTLGGDAGLATLYDEYLKPYLAWKTTEKAYPDFWAEASRNGVFQRNGDNYNTVGASGLNTIIAQKRSFAEAFEKDMIEYLNDLSSTDPIKIAFDTSVNCEPRTKATNTGRIMFPKRARSGYSRDYYDEY